MKTVVTTMKVRSGSEPEWDALIAERFRSAHGRPGWVSGQLLTPAGEDRARVLVGTWRSREDWKAWHDDPAFLERRATLERLESEPNRTQWFEVVADARAES